MTSKPADSVRFEITDEGTKQQHEDALCHQAVEFFGHDNITTTGYRHDTTEPFGLRTVAIFYDETPYVETF